MTQKWLNQAEVNMKFKSPIPKASVSAPVFPAITSWRRTNATGQQDEEPTIRKQQKCIADISYFCSSKPTQHSLSWIKAMLGEPWCLYFPGRKGGKSWSHLAVSTLAFRNQRASFRSISIHLFKGSRSAPCSAGFHFRQLSPHGSKDSHQQLQAYVLPAYQPQQMFLSTHSS